MPNKHHSSTQRRIFIVREHCTAMVLWANHIKFLNFQTICIASKWIHLDVCDAQNAKYSALLHKAHSPILNGYIALTHSNTFCVFCLFVCSVIPRVHRDCCQCVLREQQYIEQNADIGIASNWRLSASWIQQPQHHFGNRVRLSIEEIRNEDEMMIK